MWGKQDPAHATRLAEQGLAFGPPPAWISERPIPQMPADSQGSIQFHLSDTHIDLTNGRDWTFRLVQKALNADGVSRMASFNAFFDPSFERLTIHRIRVIRGDQAIDLADPDGFQLLRRETNLERRLYDGRLTADLQVPDLRPGDMLETWYTTHGVNPAIRDALDARFTFEWSDPVGATAVTLRAPETRRFTIRSQPDRWTAPPVTERRPAEGVLEQEWVDTRGGVFRYDDATPPWWNGHGRVEIVETLSWAEVADIFRASYAPPVELPASLKEAVDQIAANFPSPADRVVEALRHVQREVRYLSVSIGEGGYVPRPVDEIWARRFGDCKDVSRLLCTMLQALGIEAVPALVNTNTGEALDQHLPGVHSFDHCIARVRLDGKTYWLDGTFGEQAGDLDNLYQSQLGWALPLEANATIERMQEKDVTSQMLEVTESFVFGPRADSPAELSIEGIYRGWRADNMRSALRREGLDRNAENWLKHYAKVYGGASAIDPPRVEDDQRKNVLKLIERYRLDAPWEVSNNLARFSTVDDIFGRDLNVIPYPGRTQPLYLGAPRRVVRRTMLKLPVKWQITPWSDKVNAPGLRGRSEFLITDASRMQLEVDYEITAFSVETKDLDAFREGIEKLRTGFSVGLNHGVRDGAFATSPVAKHSKDYNIPAIAAGVFLLLLVITRIFFAH